ncbi:MAG: hypothetical protein PGN34_16255 [Methylobacterium frigidaeris]
MKALLIVLWTLAAGIMLFLVVRTRITRMTRELAGRDPAGSAMPEPAGERRDREASPHSPPAA